MNTFITTQGFAQFSMMATVIGAVIHIVLELILIFILPNFFADKAFAVFLAEPVSDLTAAAVTAITFFVSFPKILRKGPQPQGVKG